VALAFFICSMSSLIIHYHPQIYANPVPDTWVTGIGDHLNSAFVILLVLAWFGTKITESENLHLKVVFSFMAVFDAVWIILRSILFDKTQAYAMLSNSAIDASFLCCFLPLFYHYASRPYLKKPSRIFSASLVLILISAIVLTRSSTGYAGIGIATASYLVFRYRTKGLLWALGLGPLVTLASYLILDKELLNPNGRFSIWKMSYDFILSDTNKWIGSGLGTFWFWGPQIQIHNQMILQPTFQGKMDLFTWMHNDWLQVFFELGIVGALSVAILYFYLLRESWKSKSVYFCVIVTYGFIAITQMPLRLFVFQLLGVVLIREAFKNVKAQ
jgi:O-antigen ligase